MNVPSGYCNHRRAIKIPSVGSSSRLQRNNISESGRGKPGYELLSCMYIRVKRSFVPRLYIAPCLLSVLQATKAACE